MPQICQTETAYQVFQEAHVPEGDTYPALVDSKEERLGETL